MSVSKHTIYNLMGAGLPITLSLITIPLFIELIGDVRYGVLVIAWLFLDYFGLFDMGLGRATSQRIASLRDASPAQRATSFWTAILINIFIGLIGGLIAWPVAIYFFSFMFSIENLLRSEMLSAIPWLILAIPLITLSGVLTGALQGRERFLDLNIISTVGSGLLQVVPLAIAYLYGPDLRLLLPAVIFSKIFIIFALFFRCREHIFKSQKIVICMIEAKRLLKFGGWVTITMLISPLMSMADRFIIGTIFGARYVTYYSVPFQLVQRSAVIPGALASALLPRLSVADELEAKNLNNLAIRSLTVVMTPLMLAGILLIEPFISWWLNSDFAENSALLSKLLIIGFWVNAFAYVPFIYLQASGRPDLVAKCHMAEIIPYILALYFGLNYFGLTGAAVALILKAVADCLILMYLSNNLNQKLRLLIIPFMLIMAGFLITMLIELASITWYVASLSLFTASCVWSFKNMPRELHILLNRLLQFKNLFSKI